MGGVFARSRIVGWYFGGVDGRMGLVGSVLAACLGGEGLIVMGVPDVGWVGTVAGFLGDPRLRALIHWTPTPSSLHSTCWTILPTAANSAVFCTRKALRAAVRIATFFS